jgi:hypothetical protein
LEKDIAEVTQCSNLPVRSAYPKTDGLELTGTLSVCSLQTLKALYKDLFKRDLYVAATHEIEFSTLEFVVSNKRVSLHGAVWIDGHFAAEAAITLGTEGIHINGSVSSFKFGDVEIKNPALSITIRDGFNFQLSGRVQVQSHTFDVSIYVAKSSVKDLEYTVYGSYQGEFYLRNVVRALEGSFLDVSLKEVAVCFSNMDSPTISVAENLLRYPIKKGAYQEFEMTFVCFLTHLQVSRSTLKQPR